MYDQVANSPVAQQQLSQCGDSLDLEEEVLQELFKFTRHVIYDDHNSSTMAEARAVKWKSMKNKSLIRLPQMKIAYANTASVPTTWHI